MNRRNRADEVAYLESRFHLSHEHAEARTRLVCDECHKEVERLMEYEHGMTKVKLCVDCLYAGYSELRRAAYEVTK